jgi:hypothetical protein
MSSFAFIVFASTAEKSQPYGFRIAGSSIFLLIALSNPFIPIRSTLCRRFCHAGNDQDLKEYAYGGDGGIR